MKELGIWIVLGVIVAFIFSKMSDIKHTPDPIGYALVTMILPMIFTVAVVFRVLWLLIVPWFQ